MKLSNLNLTAFHTTAQTLNVTRAAEVLSITQSALSQRISSLENELGMTLFIRDSKGLIITPDGERLLRYTEVLTSLESEFLEDIGDDSLRGTLRVAGYSSIMRSKIIPTLSPIMRKNPQVNINFLTFEMKDIPDALSSARADVAILDYSLSKKGVKEVVIGEEEYVVIESAKFKTPTLTYLDHDPDDRTTELFFKIQNSVPAYKRMFMGDVYDIIEGVEQGLGRAAMSLHLIEKNSKIKIVKGFKIMKRPIILHYYDRPFYTKIEKEVMSLFENKF